MRLAYKEIQIKDMDIDN